MNDIDFNYWATFLSTFIVTAVAFRRCGLIYVDMLGLEISTHCGTHTKLKDNWACSYGLAADFIRYWRIGNRKKSTVKSWKQEYRTTSYVVGGFVVKVNCKIMFCSSFSCSKFAKWLKKNVYFWNKTPVISGKKLQPLDLSLVLNYCSFLMNCL